MPFELAEPITCGNCSTDRPAENILSAEERLVLSFKFKYCPFCGRELPVRKGYNDY